MQKISLYFPALGAWASLPWALLLWLLAYAVGICGCIVLFGVMLSVLLMVYICFLTASFFERLLGKTGIVVLTRVLGMLLAALAVQFVLDGIKGFGFGA